MKTDPTPYIRALQSEERCPACGAPRRRFVQSPETGRPVGAIAIYECTASFDAGRDGVTPMSACPTGTKVAADLMTSEAKGGQ